MNVILIAPEEKPSAGVLRLSDGRARHILRVLKSKPGDTVRIGIVNGPLGAGILTQMAGDAVELSCAFEAAIPPRPRVDLLLALPRPKVLRRLWAQLAALGVGQIILTNAWKVEKMYFDSHVLRPEVYRPLLIEGLQQAGDTRLPEVKVFKQFKVIAEDELPKLFPRGTRLLATPRNGCSIADAVLQAPAARFLLAVGPEGGWIPYEEERLTSLGFIPVSMGSRTLRTDTAAISLLALLQGAMHGGRPRPSF